MLYNNEQYEFKLSGPLKGNDHESMCFAYY